VTPDGKYVYVTDVGSGNVSVIDTASNAVAATIRVGGGPVGIAVTPDGKYVYVANGSVSVISTSNNTVIATVQAGYYPYGIAVTPDGKYVYVTTCCAFSTTNRVSVIETAHNTVIATIPVGVQPFGVGIIPPPQGVQFIFFIAKLNIQAAKRGAFDLQSKFTLSTTASNGIHPESEPVRLQVGPFITTIPAGSFKRRKDGSYTYQGVINGVKLDVQIASTGTLRYALNAAASNANLAGTTNPVQVSLSIGDDAGLGLVNAKFDRRFEAFDDGN
jgi:YVTN family beta-propeller protein